MKLEYKNNSNSLNIDKSNNAHAKRILSNSIETIFEIDTLESILYDKESQRYYEEAQRVKVSNQLLVEELVLSYTSEKKYADNLQRNQELLKKNYDIMSNRCKKGLATEVGVDNAFMELTISNQKFYEKIFYLDYYINKVD